jgi:hypothetical protein
MVASIRERRQVWPRLLAAGAIAFALALPWRIWFTAKGLPGDGPETGYFGVFSHLDRVWPALRLNVTTLFERDLWSLAPVVAVAAIVLAVLARAWRISSYAVAFVLAAVAAGTWAFWSNVGLGLNQDEWAARRLTGTTVLVVAVLTPLLLQRAWTSAAVDTAGGTGAPGPDALLSPTRWAWAIVLVGVLSHPVSMAAGYSGSGLPGGAPRWPGYEDCVSASVPGQKVRVVIGYADSYPEAHDLRGRALAAGLHGVQVAPDGCGRARVFIDVDAPAESEMLVATARAANLKPTLESATRLTS